MPDAAKKVIKNAFERIEKFSVRDENTAQFVKALSNKPVAYHLDPVAVGDFSREMAEAEDCVKYLPKKYCIIYSYYNRIYKEEEIESILNFCKRNQLTPVTVGAPQKFIKNHLVLTPFEALVTFKNAEFVITDTFHGTIFSAKYAKKFGVLVRESNKNKLLYLIHSLGISKHLMGNFDELEEVFQVEKNQQEIDAIVLRERKVSMEYLGETFKQ